MRQRGVNEDVAIAVVPTGFLDLDHLVPALHARDRVGVDREGEVLVDTRVGPPDPLGVGA